jgi:hypothetical protein
VAAHDGIWSGTHDRRPGGGDICVESGEREIDDLDADPSGSELVSDELPAPRPVEGTVDENDLWP